MIRYEIDLIVLSDDDGVVDETSNLQDGEDGPNELHPNPCRIAAAAFLHRTTHSSNIFIEQCVTRIFY